MTTFFAYFTVVLIWATTPLAIQWSGDSLSFMAAVIARMSIALALALLIHAVWRHRLYFARDNAAIYFAASIGIFPNMPVVYWAAQFIPSGLVAVIFAMSPFATGLLSMLLLRHNPFTPKRVLALLLAVSGLVIIFWHQIRFDRASIYGIGGILLSCFLFSFSSVLVKKLSSHLSVPIGAFQQATGALLFSLPGLLLFWWVMDFGVADVGLPVTISVKSACAVLYLALIGSLLGSMLFFLILQRLSASIVSLITLITPVLAILIGRWIANEVLTLETLVGVAVVLLALLLYIPWSLMSVVRHGRCWLSACFFRRLAKGALSDSHHPESGLEAIRDDMIRYK